MTNAHTPGPWLELETESSVDLQYDDGPRLGSWSDIGPEGGAPIAIALGYGGFSDHRLDANARLIAAAPCLLEALKRARRYVADLPIVGDADLAVIDAAIAKATTPNAGERG